MKKHLIEEEIRRIKRLLGESTKEVISEQLYPILSKYLGKRLLTKMESSFGDDVVVNLEKLFGKGASSILADATGEVFVLSRAGTKVPMSTISKAIDAVATGKMTAEEVSLLLPRTLKDGTEFRTVFTNELKNAKPKPKLTGAGAGTPNTSGTPKPNTSGTPKPNPTISSGGFGKGFGSTVMADEMLKQIEVDPIFSVLLKDPAKKKMIVEWLQLNCNGVTQAQFLTNTEKYLSRFPKGTDPKITNWFQKVVGGLNKGPQVYGAAKGAVGWALGILLLAVIAGGITGMDALRVIACRLSSTLCGWFNGGGSGIPSLGGGNNNNSNSNNNSGNNNSGGNYTPIKKGEFDN
jgi:TusA-related sulfurtransferase